MWRRGSSIRLGIEFPDNKTPEQVREFRDLWKDTYEGADGETTAMVGGGGTLKPIGMTMADAQYVESAKLTREDAACIFGVPANWLGKVRERTGLFEGELAEFLRIDLSPDLERFESALFADAMLYPPASGLEPGFDTRNFVRGDLATEATIEHEQIQDGSLLVDEARARRGLDPLPGGIGMIPQLVPVGGSPVGVPRPAPIPASD